MFRSRPLQIIGAVFIIFLAAGSALIYRQNQQTEIATAAVVNGERIWIEPINTQIDTMREQDVNRFKGAAGQVEEERVRELLLEERIKFKLIAQEAVKAGVNVTEAEIDTVLAERKKMLSSDSSEDVFTSAIALEGLTEETFRSRIHEELAQHKIRIKLAQEVTVAKSEIQSYIKHNNAEFKDPVEQVRLSVATFDAPPAAQQFLDGLREGRGFKELAAQMSQPVETAWYRTAWFNLSLAEAIASTGPGQQTNTLPNPDNSISVYLLEERQTRQTPETEIEAQIEAKLLREKQEQSFPKWLDSIARTADIQTNI